MVLYPLGYFITPIHDIMTLRGDYMEKPRARDLGIPFMGNPGPLNAITDVSGLTVGQVTMISGEGKLEVGKGPIRTGVTAIRPRGESFEPVFAAWDTLNGCGEMTGTIWVEESGFLSDPVLITNTYSVGVVKDAVIEYVLRHKDGPHGMPVVAETYDGFLNDIAGFHVKAEHAWEALDSAKPGPVTEGNIGGGTGMKCHDYKGGIGTASRLLAPEEGGYTVGVLVQANYGSRKYLTIAGVPVGQHLTDLMPTQGMLDDSSKSSSIIVVVATDCPLLPHQLKRLTKRVPLGIARMGGLGANGSGDIFIAFSTAPIGDARKGELRSVEMLPNELMNPLFAAVVEATEEAIVNALVAAETMQGINGNTVFALPHEPLRDILRRYGRLVE
jgi:D-aminopeptidase